MTTTREPRQLLVGVLVLGSLIFGLFGLLRRGLGESVRAGSEGTLDVGREGVEATPSRLAADASTGQRSLTRAASTAPAALPAESSTAPGLADGLLVRVLRGRSDEPIPAVRVRWVEPKLDDVQQLAHQALGSDVLDLFEAPGVREFQADEDGLVRLPRPERQAVITAQTEGFLGWKDLLNADAGESELRLMPERALHVLVTTAAGLPAAGVGVSLHYRIDESYSSIQSTKTTGSDGRTVFRGLRQHSEIYWAHTELFSVGLAGVYSGASSQLLEGVRVRIEPEDPPALVELRLPPTTALEIRLVDGHGRPHVPPAIVRIAPPQTDEDDGANQLATVAVDGVARFDQIGLGVDLVASVSCAGRERCEPLAFRSATEAGGVVELVLRVGPVAPTLVARLVDAAGEPLRDRGVSLHVRAVEEGESSHCTTQSDAEGRVRCPIDADVAKGVRLALSFRSAEASGTSVGARLMHPGKLPAGEFDLGTVPLGPGTRLVAGTVQTPAGEPIAGVTIAGQVEGENGWIASTTSDEAGHFELRGDTDASVLEVSASHEWYSDHSAGEVVVGSVGYSIVLHSTGKLVGSVIFDAEWHCDFASVKAKHGAASEKDEWEEWGGIQRPGDFELTKLLPGSYAVALGTESETDSAHVVENVVVEAGRTTVDPRLQDVDLRDVRVLSLHVDGPDGAPVESGELYHRRAGAQSWEPWEADIDAGVAHLFTRHREVDVLAVAKGARAEFVPALSAAQRISLRPGIPVRFEWSEVPAADTETRSFSMSLVTRGQPEFWIGLPRQEVAGGEVFWLPRPGRYALSHGWLVRAGGDRTWERYPEVEIEIEDRQAVQTVPLPLFRE